jgi:hypothetical protein
MRQVTAGIVSVIIIVVRMLAKSARVPQDVIMGDYVLSV